MRLNISLAVFLIMSSVPLAYASSSQNEKEEWRLLEYKWAAEKECGADRSCKAQVKKYYDEQGRILRTDPDRYWRNGGGTRQEVTRQYNTHPNAPSNSPGVVDAQGRYYAPAGNGSLIRSTDGTYMQKVGGGYVDTRTGKFVPGN